MNFLSCGGELNHHGRFMCDSMYSLLHDNYRRITTSNVNIDRLKLGYSEQEGSDYNIDGSHFSVKQMKEWISWADVIDYGAAPEFYLHEAVRQNKVVFIRMERLFKEGYWKRFVPNIRKKYKRKYTQYANCENVYYLCISAYAAHDLEMMGVKNSRVLEWAYCPEFVAYDEKKISNSEQKSLQIFWCGRMIHWKHPEIAVQIAEELKKRNVNFDFVMAGTGQKEEHIRKLIKKKQLSNYVSLIGPVKAENMRNIMFDNDIFIATSDYNEGWGVVINEAMNSGCAVIASKEMGAAPVLIEDKENGFIFDWNNTKKAADIIQMLDGDRVLLARIKLKAYRSIKNNYSPGVYAKTFVQIAEEAMEGKVNDRSGLGGKASSKQL